MRFELRMAGRFLASRRREGAVTAVTLLCTAGVFVGVATLVLALALMAGIQGDVKERLLASNPHVVVRPQAGAGGFSEDRVRSLLATLRARHGVVAAAPFSAHEALLLSRFVPGGHGAEIKAIDPESEDAVTGLRRHASRGAWEALARFAAAGPPVAPPAVREDGDDAPFTPAELQPAEPPPIVLGESLALDLGVSRGDVVHAVTLAPEMSATGPVPRARAYRVAGLLRTGLHEYDSAWALVALPPESGRSVDGVELALADPLRSPEFTDRLEDDLPAGLVLTDWTRTFERLFAAFRWEKLIMVLFLALIGIVAGFNIFTILTMNVMARSADIGILSAMGARPLALARLFTCMGLAICMGGTLAGLAAGAMFARLADRYELVRLDPAVYLVNHVSFRVVPGDLVLVAAGMLLVAFAATALPALSAARLDPVMALRKG